MLGNSGSEVRKIRRVGVTMTNWQVEEAKAQTFLPFCSMGRNILSFVPA